LYFENVHRKFTWGHSTHFLHLMQRIGENRSYTKIEYRPNTTDRSVFYFILVKEIAKNCRKKKTTGKLVTTISKGATRKLTEDKHQQGLCRQQQQAQQIQI
jgi:hypothetical protein